MYFVVNTSYKRQMKRGKKFLVLSILLLLFVVLTSNAYAEGDSTNGDVEGIREALMQIQMPIEEVDELVVVQALSEAGYAEALAGPIVTVTNFSELKEALADPGVNTVIIISDIVMEETLYINNSITLLSVGNVTLTAPGPINGERQRHFQSEASSLTIQFYNIILDGNGVGGGMEFLGTGSLSINGVVIQNCTAENGGGIFTDGMSPALLENCTFTNNYADKKGGGAYIRARAVVKDCTVTGNESGEEGGGICSVHYSGYTPVTISGCVVRDNTSVLGGGLRLPTDTSIEDCIIENNHARDGGGIYGPHNLDITDSDISRNTAEGNGGGIWLTGHLLLTTTTVSNNTAEESGGGAYGVMYHIRLSDSSITGNEAVNGGGVHGFIVDEGHYLSMLGESYISGNTAVNGGGCYLEADPNYQYGNLSIEDSSILDNNAVTGGGVYIKSHDKQLEGRYYIRNTSIMNNHAVDAGGIYVDILEWLEVEDNVIFSGNEASIGYHLTDPDTIAIHQQNIHTTSFSAPFTDYAYNNYDIGYTGGEPVFLANVSFYLRQSDTEPYAVVTLYTGESLQDLIPENPVIDGFRFIGWSDENDAPYDKDTVITGHTNLYAGWKFN